MKIFVVHNCRNSYGIFCPEYCWRTWSSIDVYTIFDWKEENTLSPVTL